MPSGTGTWLQNARDKSGVRSRQYFSQISRIIRKISQMKIQISANLRYLREKETEFICDLQCANCPLDVFFQQLLNFFVIVGYRELGVILDYVIRWIEQDPDFGLREHAAIVIGVAK
jgi:hypothetical protein